MGICVGMHCTRVQVESEFGRHMYSMEVCACGHSSPPRGMRQLKSFLCVVHGTGVWYGGAPILSQLHGMCVVMQCRCVQIQNVCGRHNRGGCGHSGTANSRVHGTDNLC